MKTMKHIMLVEDEVELAQLVRDYLEAAGFEVSKFHCQVRVRCYL